MLDRSPGGSSLVDRTDTASVQTPLCRVLGLTAPVVQAPIGSAATPALAAAVSNAGGLGMLALSWTPPDAVRARLRDVRARTERPFGANVILEWDQRERIAACLAESVPVVSTFWGDPAPYVELIHAGNALHLHSVGSAAEADHAVAAGVDVIVAQGWEAGGRVRGQVASLVLVPSVVDAVHPVPVIAAGGVADGRGLASVLALGADAAWVGTRFLLAEEAAVHAHWRVASARRARPTRSTPRSLTGAGRAPHTACCATAPSRRGSAPDDPPLPGGPARATCWPRRPTVAPSAATTRHRRRPAPPATLRPWRSTPDKAPAWSAQRVPRPRSSPSSPPTPPTRSRASHHGHKHRRPRAPATRRRPNAALAREGKIAHRRPPRPPRNSTPSRNRRSAPRRAARPRDAARLGSGTPDVLSGRAQLKLTPIITFTWFTNTGVSSARLYHENAFGFFDAKGVTIPAAVSVFPRELYQAPRSSTERAYPNLIYYNAVDRGDHFAAWQEPEPFSAEVRAAFRSLR